MTQNARGGVDYHTRCRRGQRSHKQGDGEDSENVSYSSVHRGRSLCDVDAQPSDFWQPDNSPFPHFNGDKRRVKTRPFSGAGKPSKTRFSELSASPHLPMNFSRNHGSDIQDVSARGSSRASPTVSHPRGNASNRTHPLSEGSSRTPCRTWVVLVSKLDVFRRREGHNIASGTAASVKVSGLVDGRPHETGQLPVKAQRSASAQARGAAPSPVPPGLSGEGTGRNSSFAAPKPAPVGRGYQSCRSARTRAAAVSPPVFGIRTSAKDERVSRAPRKRPRAPFRRLRVVAGAMSSTSLRGTWMLAPSAGQAVLSGRSRVSVPIVGTSEGSRAARTGGKHGDAPCPSGKRA